jgi:hypothetical protein
MARWRLEGCCRESKNLRALAGRRLCVVLAAVRGTAVTAFITFCTRSPTLDDEYRTGSGAHFGLPPPCREEEASLAVVLVVGFINVVALVRELPLAGIAAEEKEDPSEQLYGVFNG